MGYAHFLDSGAPNQCAVSFPAHPHKHASAGPNRADITPNNLGMQSKRNCLFLLLCNKHRDYHPNLQVLEVLDASEKGSLLLGKLRRAFKRLSKSKMDFVQHTLHASGLAGRAGEYGREGVVAAPR